ncbi:MAG: FkbM family methyltransferase [Methanobrevibacter sp.]|nr:FkbM family methyltransferase [Candidatus Methanovirga basalitermitum]
MKVENISLNEDLKDRIKLINKVVGCKNGKIKIFFDNINSSGGASKYIDAKNFQLIETVTIDAILNDYDIEPFILKLDCEGCEYDIILNTDLSKFNLIFFEYHAGIVGKDTIILFEKLENQGFKMEKYNC